MNLKLKKELKKKNKKIKKDPFYENIIALDVDGVLRDVFEPNRKTIIKVFKERGFDKEAKILFKMDRATFKRFFLASEKIPLNAGKFIKMASFFIAFFNNIKDLKEIEKISTFFNNYKMSEIYRKFSFEEPLFPQAKKFFKELKYNAVLISSSKGTNRWWIYKRMGFKFLPNLKIYENLFSKEYVLLSISKNIENVYFVTDKKQDILRVEELNNKNITSIGVLTGLGTEEQFKSLKVPYFKDVYEAYNFILRKIKA